VIEQKMVDALFECLQLRAAQEDIVKTPEEWKQVREEMDRLDEVACFKAYLDKVAQEFL
jgi:hypothetical protein